MFDYQYYAEELTLDPTSLDRLNARIDWEFFRKELEYSLEYKNGSHGGRRPFDPILMLKVIVLQRYFNLSEEETEFQIKDRFSFQRFIGVTVADSMPDKNTIWNFKERLGKAGVKQLFKKFETYLRKSRILVRKGKIVDASFVEVPRQRNSRQENKEIKNGQTPDSWKNNQNKMRQKDVDARWATKNKERHYGYKNHIKIDAKTKIIEDFEVTDASVHDSNVFIELLNPDTDGIAYADSAYRSAKISEELKELGIKDQIHEKGYRGYPLSDEAKKRNTKKSKIRARVEHVFGYMENSMRGTNMRTIGIDRASRGVGITNFVYNLFRFVQIHGKMV